MIGTFVHLDVLLICYKIAGYYKLAKMLWTISRYGYEKSHNQSPAYVRMRYFEVLQEALGYMISRHSSKVDNYHSIESKRIFSD